MSKLTLWIIGFVSMFLAFGLTVLILLIFGDTYWSVVPMIVWFIAGQIWLVPRILKK